MKKQHKIYIAVLAASLVISSAALGGSFLVANADNADGITELREVGSVTEEQREVRKQEYTEKMIEEVLSRFETEEEKDYYRELLLKQAADSE